MEVPLAFKPREAGNTAVMTTKAATEAKGVPIPARTSNKASSPRSKTISNGELDFILGDLSFLGKKTELSGADTTCHGDTSALRSIAATRRQRSSCRKRPVDSDEPLDHAAVTAFLNCGAWNLMAPPSTAQLEKAASLLEVKKLSHGYSTAENTEDDVPANSDNDVKTMTWDTIYSMHKTVGRRFKRSRRTLSPPSAAAVVDSVMPLFPSLPCSPAGSLSPLSSSSPSVSCKASPIMWNRADEEKVKNFLAVGAWNDLAPSASSEELSRAGAVLGLATVESNAVNVEWEDVSSMVTEPSRHSPTKASIKVANTAKSAAMLRAKALGQSGLFESSEFGSDSSDCITGLNSFDALPSLSVSAR